MSATLVDELLTEAADRWPNRPAIRAGGRTLTYAELDMAANRVASALTDMGVGHRDRVGLYLEKGHQAVTAIYAIMRAGATYVPLDPAAPPSRAALIARNCEIAAIVGDADRVERLLRTDGGGPDRGITCGTGPPPDGFMDWEEAQTASSDPLRPTAVDADLAYILYTSGSTGVPKGVMISHRNALSFIEWAFSEFELRPDDVLSNHAPLHFDLSVLDLFGAARSGAACAIVPRTTALFPQELARWIQTEKITVWYSAPSALSLLVSYGGLSDATLRSLRLILFAGEVFPNKYLSALMHGAPQARFYNLFGPTETNVCSFYEVAEPPDPADPPVPIGTACGETECFVVDESGRRIDENDVEGELVVRGPIVARGYWGQADQIANGFVEPDTYRTGDIVYWENTGDARVLRFVGRRDHMVKTRGYRVELGEIESILNSHENVREAAAIAIPDELAGNRIVACCVPRDIDDVEPLRAFCRERLPLYMVPTAFVLRAALPRNSNGKIDRLELVADVLTSPSVAGEALTQVPGR
jgi:L-proline---[L-prolyl-carrier protein] ligase